MQPTFCFLFFCNPEYQHSRKLCLSCTLESFHVWCESTTFVKNFFIINNKQASPAHISKSNIKVMHIFIKKYLCHCKAFVYNISTTLRTKVNLSFTVFLTPDQMVNSALVSSAPSSNSPQIKPCTGLKFRLLDAQTLARPVFYSFLELSARACLFFPFSQNSLYYCFSY